MRYSILNTTRTDLTYIINLVCQCMHAPSANHSQAVKRILRYIKSTFKFGIYQIVPCTFTAFLMLIGQIVWIPEGLLPDTSVLIMFLEVQRNNPQLHDLALKQSTVPWQWQRLN